MTDEVIGYTDEGALQLMYVYSQVIAAAVRLLC